MNQQQDPVNTEIAAQNRRPGIRNLQTNHINHREYFSHFFFCLYCTDLSLCHSVVIVISASFIIPSMFWKLSVSVTLYIYTDSITVVCFYSPLFTVFSVPFHLFLSLSLLGSSRKTWYDVHRDCLFIKRSRIKERRCENICGLVCFFSLLFPFISFPPWYDVVNRDGPHTLFVHQALENQERERRSADICDRKQRRSFSLFFLHRFSITVSPPPSALSDSGLVCFFSPLFPFISSPSSDLAGKRQRDCPHTFFVSVIRFWFRLIRLSLFPFISLPLLRSSQKTWYDVNSHRYDLAGKHDMTAEPDLKYGGLESVKDLVCLGGKLLKRSDGSRVCFNYIKRL